MTANSVWNQSGEKLPQLSEESYVFVKVQYCDLHCHLVAKCENCRKMIKPELPSRMGNGKESEPAGMRRKPTGPNKESPLPPQN